jgi:isoquinoline 1-oxidoreductase subunit alpha
MITLNVNGKTAIVDAESDTPLLWVLRDYLNLTGAKFGCGIGACGACTVHLDGAAVRSCVVPVSGCEGHKVTTIEGLSRERKPTQVQQAWIEHQVPQCGYRQSGMIMSAEALMASNPKPSDADIANAISNICRCGTYPRVRKAVQSLAAAKPIRS